MTVNHTSSPSTSYAQPLPAPPRRALSGWMVLAVGLILSVVTGLLVGTLPPPPTPNAAIEAGSPPITQLVVAFACGFLSLAALLVGSLRLAWGTKVSQLQELAIAQHEMNILLSSIHDRQLLSDTARRVANRQAERQILRQAIRDERANGDRDAALTAIDHLGQVYGYREEAEVLRDEILQQDADGAAGKIQQHLSRLDELIAKFAWDQAYAEVGRIERMFPNDPRAKELEQRIRTSYDARKRQLEREFLTAAGREDVELAMSLMKQLDRYLSEAEAEPFRETARGVIGKKRDNLGVQFKLFVQDKEWTSALEVGQQIIREFPNTKMAQEVRDMLDVLRQRAAEQAAATRQINRG
ncbi:MAG: hypothetical protein IT441_02795 [Phycisphaeraceae bacterium]|nr:hypothetical protein [Phycisphaeraceae bacterium]